MTRIYDDFQFAIDKVGVAVVLRINPPYKGMEAVKYLHKVNLLSWQLGQSLKNYFSSEFYIQIDLWFKDLAQRLKSVPVRRVEEHGGNRFDSIQLLILVSR